MERGHEKHKETLPNKAGAGSLLLEVRREWHFGFGCVYKAATKTEK